MIQFICRDCGHEFPGNISTFVCQQCSSRRIKKIGEANQSSIRVSGGGSKTATLIMLGVILLPILFFGGKKIMDILKPQPPTAPFEIVVPEMSKIDSTFHVITVRDSNGKIIPFNKNFHRGLEFKQITVNGEPLSLYSENQIIPCLSISDKEKEVFITWEVTEPANWTAHTVDYPDMSLIFTSNNDHENADCYIIPKIMSYTQSDSCHVTVNMGEHYEKYKEHIQISIDGENYQNNNVFYFSNEDYGTDSIPILISAYFESKKDYTFTEYHGNCTNCFFDNCADLYYLDPMIIEKDKLIDQGISLGDYMNKSCGDNWKKLQNQELDSCIASAIKLRGEEMATEVLRSKCDSLGLTDCANMAKDELSMAIANTEKRNNLESEAKKLGIAIPENISNNDLEAKINAEKKKRAIAANSKKRGENQKEVMRAFSKICLDPFDDVAGDNFTSFSYLKRTSFIYNNESLDVNDLYYRLMSMPETKRKKLNLTFVSWKSDVSSSPSYGIPLEIRID